MSETFHQPDAARIVCVIGTRGQGKSYWRARYLSNIRRCVLWNPCSPDGDIGKAISVSDFLALPYKSRAKIGILRVTIDPARYETLVSDFNSICAACEEIGALHLAIEEPGLVMTPQSIPPAFLRLCVKGRHAGVSLSLYGQRFSQLPVIARGQASEIIAFRQSDPIDVRDFNARIAPETSPLPINQLPEHHFVRYTPATGAVYHSPLSRQKETTA